MASDSALALMPVDAQTLSAHGQHHHVATIAHLLRKVSRRSLLTSHPRNISREAGSRMVVGRSEGLHPSRHPGVTHIGTDQISAAIHIATARSSHARPVRGYSWHSLVVSQDSSTHL